MSVSFPRICNEIFAGAAGLRAAAQSKPHCPGRPYLRVRASQVIYTVGTFLPLLACARAPVRPRVRICNRGSRVRVNGTSESRCFGALSVGNDLPTSFLLAAEGK